MKLNTHALRYLTHDDWRVLAAVEQGSKNHEVVPTPLIIQISGLRGASGVNRAISTLAKNDLIAKVKNAKCKSSMRRYFPPTPAPASFSSTGANKLQTMDTVSPTEVSTTSLSTPSSSARAPTPSVTKSESEKNPTFSLSRTTPEPSVSSRFTVLDVSPSVPSRTSVITSGNVTLQVGCTCPVLLLKENTLL